ncbi:MAG: hypothetical protein JWR77_656 [Rhizorhabdus sp.]|nr:hypothetical protein [Rhizorhabdus sp.]
MRITADTNILLRAVLPDDHGQQQAAIGALKSAELVAVSVHALCEFVWVMRRSYKAADDQIAEAIRRLIEMHNVIINRPAVEAGLRMLEAGGDFADGVIAFDGQWLGSDTFLSFDQKAVKLLTERGEAAELLA